MKKQTFASLLLIPFLVAASSFAQVQPAAPPPDDRFKADILLIVAHSDDEGMAVGYLAKAILDQHKRVAVIYGTRGNGGGNAIGLEQAAALGAEREMEARRAVASVGITNVWFVGAPDTPGQDVLRSLETWKWFVFVASGAPGPPHAAANYYDLASGLLGRRKSWGPSGFQRFSIRGI